MVCRKEVGKGRSKEAGKDSGKVTERLNEMKVREQIL